MTDEQKRPKKAIAEETRTLCHNAALKQGKDRSDKVKKQVQEIFTTIEQELKDNNGQYPHNNGDLSQAEVARRAGVHPTTFYTPKQRELRVRVQNWLLSLSRPKTEDVPVLPRSLAKRVNAWKTLYGELAQSHRDTELQLQQTEAELLEAREDLATLRNKYQTLLRLLNDIKAGKVVSLRNQGQDSF